MNTVTTEIKETAFEWLDSSTNEMIRLARNDAINMQASEIFPEHLLLRIIVQGDHDVASLLDTLSLDLQKIRTRVAEIFSLQSGIERDDSALPLSKEAKDCISWAFSFAMHMHSPSIHPAHLLLGVLRHPRAQPILALLVPDLETLPAHLIEAVEPAYTCYMDQFIDSRVREQSIIHFNKGTPRRLLRSFERPAITFADILGLDAAKHQLRDVVEFLKVPQRFQLLQRNSLRGVLLVGHKSIDRTLLVRAIAGEAVVPLVTLSILSLIDLLAEIDADPSGIEDLDLPASEYNIFKSKEGVQRGREMIRYVFDQAKDVSPCLLLIEDIEAIERLNSTEESEQLRKQLLIEIDGLDSHPPMVIIATTHRADALGEMLLQPGHFDRRIVLSGSFMQHPAAPTKLCLACKYEVLFDWKYCAYCGASLASLCPQCGALRPELEGARFCFECGIALL